MLQRRALFSKGAIDYIALPIIPNELVNRVFAYLHFFSADKLNHKARVIRKAVSPIEKIDQQGLVNKTCLYLREHLSDPITLPILAAKMGTNRTRLSEHFKKNKGVGVMTWLRKKRLQKAKYLIGNSTRNIQQIAFEVGYPNAANFSTAFKLEFGMTPKTYRKTLLKPKVILMNSKV